MRPLNRELTSQYDINIKRYQYIRSNYYLETNRGKFVLRKVDLTKDQILFNYEVDTHLKESQFVDINAIYTTKKKAPYAALGNQYYILQTYINCEETDFKDFDDLKSTIAVLARFHKAARNVRSKIRDIETVKIKNIYDYYSKRMLENAKLKKNMTTLKQKSNFELMFLEAINDYRSLEEMALDSISHDLAAKLIEDVKRNNLVAHRDYTYHTVNKTATGNCIMSQIDVCNYDIQVVDLSQILCKIMQKNDWDSQLLYTLIESYNKINPLSANEFKLLKFMLIYPEKYNSICFKYIGSKRRWNYSMFEQKWESMLEYKENQIATAKIINTW